MKFVAGRYTSGQVMDSIIEVESWITREYLKDPSNGITDTEMQKDMENRMLDYSFGKNECVFDDNNAPSIYVVYNPDEKAWLTYLNNSQTHFTTNNGMHPAFIVNGDFVQILIGKYLAGRVGGSNKAVSLRGLDPAHSINFDNALSACASKGVGHHIMTNAEWAYLTLLALREGFQPRGNDNYGRSYQDGSERGTPTIVSGSNFGRTLTGSGPLGWHLDGSILSPADMRGNVLEWLGGYRTVDGELQVLENNNAADSSKDQSSGSALWKAILEDGSLVAPGTADTYKWDYKTTPPAEGSAAYELVTSLTYQQPNATPYGGVGFGSLTPRAGVDVHDILRILLLMPTLANPALGSTYMRNVGERLSCAGGDWDRTSGAGLGYRTGTERSSTSTYIGFRPALYRTLRP